MKPFPKLKALDPVMAIAWWHEAGTKEEGYPVDGAYVERFWLPVVGPSALWIARRLTTWLGCTIVMTELATDIGLQASIGANAPMTKSVYRLIHFGFVNRVDDLLEVRTHVGPVPLGLLKRSPHLRREAESQRWAPARANVS